MRCRKGGSLCPIQNSCQMPSEGPSLHKVSWKEACRPDPTAGLRAKLRATLPWATLPSLWIQLNGPRQMPSIHGPLLHALCPHEASHNKTKKEESSPSSQSAAPLPDALITHSRSVRSGKACKGAGLRSRIRLASPSRSPAEPSDSIAAKAHLPHVSRGCHRLGSGSAHRSRCRWKPRKMPQGHSARFDVESSG